MQVVPLKVEAETGYLEDYRNVAKALQLCRGVKNSKGYEELLKGYWLRLFSVVFKRSCFSEEAYNDWKKQNIIHIF